MNFNSAWRYVGGLGSPSKMPGYAYGISALMCQVGKKLAAKSGTVCSSCYALKGNYTLHVVAKAHKKRLASLRKPKWVEAMAVLLTRLGKKHPHFRWHDSGDLQSEAHLELIVEVAQRTPQISHWLPTREVHYVSSYLKKHHDFPPNLCVRVSAPLVDGPILPHYPNTSTVHRFLPPAGHSCPAKSQGNKCLTCRACWDRSILNVSYQWH